VKNPVLVQMLTDSKVKAATKASRTTPNAANLVAAHLRATCPDLCDVPDLWFSGSNVWKALYGETPDPDADIDVFMLQAPRDPADFDEYPFSAGWRLCQQLGIPCDDTLESGVTTGRDEDLYAMGMKALYKGRKLDIWEGASTVRATLENYPTRTHAHCRAAFSFTEGLVVLPNEAA
jgi:hypothetical protein